MCTHATWAARSCRSTTWTPWEPLGVGRPGLGSRTSRTDVSTGIVGAELQGPDPRRAMANRWGEVLGRAPEQVGGSWRIGLDDGGEIRFAEATDGRGEGLGRFDVAVRDPAAVHRWRRRRPGWSDGDVVLAGTRVRLVQA